MCNISIVITVYNVAQYLERCLNSVLAQTYQNFEIILVNDASTDGSATICKRFSSKNSRIRYFELQHNMGVSYARNFGLKQACGQYVGFVDGDDWIEKDMYSTLIDLITRYGTKLVACNFNVHKLYDDHLIATDIDVNGKDILFENTFDLLIYYVTSNDAYLWNKLYSKELFDDIVFPLGKDYEDLYVMHKIYEKAEKMVVTRIPLYNYVLRQGSIVHKKLNFDKLFALIERHKDLSEKYCETIEKRCRKQIFRTLLSYVEDIESLQENQMLTDDHKEKYNRICSEIFDQYSFFDCGFSSKEEKRLELLKKGYAYFEFLRKLRNINEKNKCSDTNL